MNEQTMAPAFTSRVLTANDLKPVEPLIEGRSQPSTSEGHFTTYDPATGQRLIDIAQGSAADVDRAVRAARTTFESGAWRSQPAAARKAILLRWADLIERDADLLDALDALEMGKPVGLQTFNARIAAGFVRFNAEAIDKIAGVVLPSDSASTVTQHLGPRGVVAAIVPWNFPTYNCVLKLAPALAAGNSVVLKPSEFASQTALRVAGLAHEAGLPAGVLNVVPGHGGIVGRALAEHMDIDMVTFTGSSAVGKLILQYAGASNMKVVGAECGGKSPQIVFDDGIELDAIASHIARTIVTNQGQVCSFGSRILVQRSLQAALVERIAARLGDIVVGDPQRRSTTYGPLVSAGQRDKVLGFVERAQARGAHLACGGTRLVEDSGGYFVAPTIVTDVAPDSEIAQEEIFGPVVSVLPFSDVEEAIRLAKDTRYGLAAYIWSSRAVTGFKVANALPTAITVVNADAVVSSGAGFAFSCEPAALSGIGIEGGLAGLEAYQRRQTIWHNHG